MPPERFGGTFVLRLWSDPQYPDLPPVTMVLEHGALAGEYRSELKIYKSRDKTNNCGLLFRSRLAANRPL